MNFPPPSGCPVSRSPMPRRVGPRRSVLLGALLVLGALADGPMVLAAPDGDGPDTRTMVVTSDSSAYCRSLSGAIEAHGALPREVRELKVEGDGMCNEGQVRGGIARLRRALMVLHKEPPADAAAPR